MSPPQLPTHSFDINAGFAATTLHGTFTLLPDTPPTSELTGVTLNLGVNYSRYFPAGPLRFQVGGGLFYEFSSMRGATLDAFDRPVVLSGTASQGPGISLEAGISYPTSSFEIFLKLRSALLYSNGTAGEMLLGTLNPQIGLRYNLGNQGLGLGLGVGPIFGTALVSNTPVDLPISLMTVTTFSF